MIRYLALAGALGLLALTTGCGDKSPKVDSSSTTPVIGQILPTRGPTEGGTLAVIRGNNFRPGTTVSFGDATATFVKVVDATTLTVVTPPGAVGRVNVVISSAEGQSTTFTDGFEFYEKDGSVPAPLLTAINPNTGPASGGTVALVTGDHFQEGILLFVGRSPGSDVVVADAMTLSGTLPPGDVGSADVEVTNPDGQTTKLEAAFAYSSAEGVAPVLSAVTPVAGTTLGGTVVGLSGTNLKAGMIVFFGGRLASAVTTQGTTASATTPPGAPGVVDVAVTNPDGRSAVLRRGYNYYVGGPIISRITPNFGPPDGGTEVVLDGRNFGDRVVATIGGSTIQALRRIDERSLVGLTPAGPAGAADVRVENPDGQSDTLVNGWAWGSAPPPTFSVARVTPEIGPITGGTRVTVIGSGFESGATVTFGGQPGTGVQVVGGATISCVTPSGMVGPVEVVVTQGGNREAKLPLGFWYFDPAQRGSTPSIAAVTPALGPQTGGTMVMITGGGYAAGARVYFGALEATQVTVVSSSTLTAVTPAAAAPGPVDVRVQNADGQVVTQNQGFVYVDPRALGPAPVISAVNPNNGGSADSTAVVITAQNVTPGALVFAGGVPATGVTIGTGMVTGTFLPHPAGQVDVVITNPDGNTGKLVKGFTYNRSPPVLTSVTPNTVPLGGGLKVLLAGKGFEAGATVTVDGVQVPTTFVDDTLVFITAPAHAAGTVDVTVTNTDQQSSTLAGGLTYANITLGNAPAVTSITPARGPTTGGTVALVIGTNFTQGIRVLFGSTPATGVTVMSDTRLSAVAPAGAAGVVDLTVVNPDGQSAQLLRGFTWVDPSQLGTGPQIASITPSSGLSTGGTQTVLTGSGFQPGMLVFFGGYSAAAAATQNSGIATATSPAGPRGRVDVAITNPDGQSAVLPLGFSYTPRPELTTIFPAQGPTTGGTSFTIAGNNFAAGARVYFGMAEASGVMVGSATVITGTTPPNPLGAVDVRVVNVDQQEGVLTGGFTYNPPPNLLTVKPGGGPLAGGTTIQVAGTGFQPGAVVRVGGTTATEVRVVSSTVLYAVTPSGVAGAADVQITNPDSQVATLARAFRYDAVDTQAKRATSYPDVVVPMARDDAAYRSDLGVANLAGRPVQVTVTAYDNSGNTIGSRALAAAIPAFGRAVVTDVFRFAAAATTQQDKTGSVVVTADGPVSAYVQLTDRSSGDGAVIPGSTIDRTAARLLVPYASNVGAFRTWLAVRNLGTTAATVDVIARAADGSQAGRISALSIAPNATYTNDDVLGTMSVSNSNVTLEINGAGAQLLGVARVYSNGRLGGVIQARPYTDASSTQVLGYVPDTTLETSVLYLTNTDPSGVASATVELFTSQGQSLGTRTVSVPANGFVSVPDLARTLLSRTTPTQTVSSVHVTSPRALMTAAFVLSTSNSDVRLYNGHTGGGMRMVLAAAEPRTGLTIANAGLGSANVEIALRVDSGATRGNPLTVTIPSRGLFNAGLVLSSLGAGSASGVVEVRSLSGTPLLVVARVANDPGGALGDTLDIGTIATTPSLDSLRPNSGPATGGTMAKAAGAFLLPQAQFLFGDVPASRSFVSGDDTAVVVSPQGTIGQVVDLTAINFDGTATKLPNAFGYMDPALLGVAPTIASVTPGQVSILGGTPMQVNGANFASQAQAFVGLSPMTGTTQVNPGRVDGAAPPGPIGLADVTITNPDGQSATLTSAVRYVVPPPTIATVTPNTGPGSGGTSVRINGAGFQVGATVSFGGSSAPTATVLSPTDIDVVAPLGADGPVAITIVNPDGQSVTLNNAFTYVAPPNPVQVTPSSGPTTGGTQITITGTFFRTGATVEIGPNACQSVSVQMGGTSLTCTTPTGASGPVAVKVTNPDNQVGLLNNAFTYLAPVPPPTVTGVSPAFGPVTGGTQVTVLGTNFQAGAAVRFGTIAAPAANVISPSAIVVTIPGQAGPGSVGVTVTNPDSQFATLANGFNYFQPADLPALTVVSLTPNQGPTTGGTVVFVSGRGFKAGAQVRFGANLGTNVQYLGPSALQVTTPPSAAGNVDVTVVNPDAASSTLGNGYNYNDGVVFRLPPSRLPLTQERGTNMTRLFDVDNDGDLDAYMGRYNSNYDSDGNDQLWLNDGTGTFLRDPSFAGDGRNNTQDVVIDDFDGNGTKDMFVIPDNAAYWSGSDLARFIRNYPVGTYTVINQSAIAGCCTQFTQRTATVGDLNSDGYKDVYVTVSGLDYYYRNQLDGGFVPTRAGLPAINDDSTQACIADYDRDGDDDLFVVNTSNQQANYYLQGTPGTFTLSNALIPVVGGAGAGCVAAEFRSGTGIIDIVVVKAGQIYQYLVNDGTGRFTDEAATLNIHHLPSTPPSLNIARKPQAIDLDSDGDLDIVMRHTDTNPRYQAYMNDGASFFLLGTASRIPALLDAQGEGGWGDVNSDGSPDLLIPGDGQQSRLLLNGSSGLQYATMKTIPEMSVCVPDSINIDIDDDGDEDIVFTHGCKRSDYGCSAEPASCRGNKVKIWINDGAGGFTDGTSTRFPSTTYNATSIASADFDLDGDPDLIIGGYTGYQVGMPNQSVYLYLNDGNGVFTNATYPRIPSVGNNWVTSLQVIDINKDGAPDILEADASDNCGCRYGYFKLYLNTGNGFFFNVSNQLPYTQLSSTCNEGAYTLAAGDFDRDGYLDVHVGVGGRARLWLNRGAVNPGFYVDVTNSNVPNVSDTTLGNIVADLNGDTFPDIFACNTATDRINLGNSLGVLSDVTTTNWPGESQPYPYQSMISGNHGPLSSESCTAGDVDLDGDVDIIVSGGSANGFNHRNRLYENSGNALFTDRTVRSMPYDTAYTQEVQLFKANGDNRLDLFVGNCGQPYVLLNGP
jgi:hypothetical protein